MKKIIFSAFVFGVTVLSFAQNVSVTVYNENLGVVRETRTVAVQKGETKFYVSDVPTAIDPSTVHIKFDGKILEQNYKYDLASKTAILRKYIDKEIELINSNGEALKGKLISLGNNDVVLSKNDGGLVMISDLKNYKISVNSLPEGFVTKPTLEYLAESNKSGNTEIEISYFTGGMQWQAEYVAVLNNDDTQMKLNSWVSIKNNSGKTFKNAKVKLVAGDVNRAKENQPYPVLTMAKDYGRAEPEFEERSFFEYHIYELQRPTTLANREEKQIAFFNSDKISVGKKYVFNCDKTRNGKAENVEVSVEFKNDKKNGLGVPLPAGVVRLFKTDGDNLEFIGEDDIEHTAKNETVYLSVGKAFDIKGTVTEVSREKIAKDVYEMQYKIVLSNAKNQKVNVEVLKSFYGDWKITDTNLKFEKTNSRTAKFNAAVPAEGKTEIKFAVRITR